LKNKSCNYLDVREYISGISMGKSKRGFLEGIEEIFQIFEYHDLRFKFVLLVEISFFPKNSVFNFRY